MIKFTVLAFETEKEFGEWLKKTEDNYPPDYELGLFEDKSNILDESKCVVYVKIDREEIKN